MKAYVVQSILVFMAAALASAVGKSESFFDSDEVVVLQLEAPLATLKKQRGENPEWLEGRVRLAASLGEEEVLDIEMKARGNFRRLKSTCPFPSYWLNFKKKQTKGTLFSGVDKIKIVAHCRERRRSFEPYIYKEYLAYKTYNLLSDLSFRVRLARITYIDTDGKSKPKTYAAFFIEHVDSFAERHEATQIEERYVQPSLYDQFELCRAELFQFFVGNSDFSFFASHDECCHNGKAFLFEDEINAAVPVPYDFDMSGIVDTPYATISGKIPIKSVRDRYYRGMTVSDEVFDTTVALYQEKRPEIYHLWENASVLSEKERQKTLAFIDKFYEILEDPEYVKTQILNRMRNVEQFEKLIVERVGELESAKSE